jgi:hypothetical protein
MKFSIGSLKTEFYRDVEAFRSIETRFQYPRNTMAKSKTVNNFNNLKYMRFDQKYQKASL